MEEYPTYPRVVSVEPRSGRRLLVTFSDGTRKVYDCTPLLSGEVFAPLKDDALFRSVKADPGGYGVVWNDNIDLAESELWINSQPIERENQASR